MVWWHFDWYPTNAKIALFYLNVILFCLFSLFILYKIFFKVLYSSDKKDKYIK